MINKKKTFTFRKLYLLWNKESIVCTRTYMLNFMNWIYLVCKVCVCTVHSSRIVCLQSVRVTLHRDRSRCAQCTVHSTWIFYEQKHFLACDTMTHCDRSCCVTSLSTYNVLSFSVTSWSTLRHWAPLARKFLYPVREKNN